MPDNKNTPSTHHPRRRNVTTLMVGLKKKTVTYAKISPKSGEPQRHSWGTQKKKKKKKKKTCDFKAKTCEMLLLFSEQITVQILGTFFYNHLTFDDCHKTCLIALLYTNFNKYKTCASSSFYSRPSW